MGRLLACPKPSWSAAMGTILYKLVGPVTPANLDSVLKVEIEKALNGDLNGMFYGSCGK